MALGGFDGSYDGKITIKQGQGITWAIADELGLEKGDLKKINGSIWQNIMNIVDDQKNKGGANYGGGNDLNGATNKNFVVNKGDVFVFTKENWNKIVAEIKKVLPDKTTVKELTAEGDSSSGNVEVTAYKAKVEGETQEQKLQRQAENLKELDTKMGEPPTKQQLESAVDYLIGDEVLNLEEEKVKNLRTQLYSTKFDNEYLTKLAENAEKTKATKENLLALIKNIESTEILDKINLNGLPEEIKAEVQKAIDKKKAELEKSKATTQNQDVTNISKAFVDATWRPGTNYKNLSNVINNDINKDNILEVEKQYNDTGHNETLIETVLFEKGLDFGDKRSPLITKLAEYWFLRAEGHGIDVSETRRDFKKLIDTIETFAQNNKAQFLTNKILNNYF